MNRYLTPQDKFEIAVAGTLLANEAGRTDLQKMFTEMAIREAQKMKSQRQRAASRGTIRRVANRDGIYS